MGGGENNLKKTDTSQTDVNAYKFEAVNEMNVLKRKLEGKERIWEAEKIELNKTIFQLGGQLRESHLEISELKREISHFQDIATMAHEQAKLIRQLRGFPSPEIDSDYTIESA
jgi:hypothetical protein